MKKIIAPGIVMPRIKHHRTMLNKLLDNERLSGSRRMLGIFLATWMDLYDHPEAQQQVMDIIQGAWGNGNKTRWVDSDEDVVPEGQSNVEKESVQKIKDIFNLALEESGNVVPTS